MTSNHQPDQHPKEKGRGKKDNSSIFVLPLQLGKALSHNEAIHGLCHTLLLPEVHLESVKIHTIL